MSRTKELATNNIRDKRYIQESPFIDEITVGGWQLDADGMLAIPTTPGLGLELDPDAVKKYTRGEKLF